MLSHLTSGLRRELGRIRVRILAVLSVAIIVPVAGLELARVVERQLLDWLERDMRDQAVLVSRMLEVRPIDPAATDAEAWALVLKRTAGVTGARFRVLGPSQTLVDSHAAPQSEFGGGASYGGYGWSTRPFARTSYEQRPWPAVIERREVREAFDGDPSSATRVRPDGSEVRFFVTEPVRSPDGVAFVVYVDRSTRPVLFELYQVREQLLRILLVSFVLAVVLTLVLAWSISRPMTRLAKAARAIARQPYGAVPYEVPLVGSGEIRDLADALRAMAGRLVERATSVQNFAADVAHEFKSPLTSIRGAAELLLEGADEDAPARHRFLQNIREDSERLDLLVSRLLELSRLESSTAEMVVVDLEVLTKAVASRYENVQVTVEGTPRFVRGRKGDLELALKNVIENAIRYSPPSEVVSVELSSDPGFVELRIVDRGPGIPPDHLHQVFDRFFTTDKDGRGTGLGLAIVLSVIHAHGGTAEAVSPVQNGKGTLVRLRLPAL